jgi:hypothetical protein
MQPVRDHGGAQACGKRWQMVFSPQPARREPLAVSGIDHYPNIREGLKVLQPNERPQI